jgi:hypothetical protein
LFNPDPQQAKPRHWLDDTWLNSSSKPIANFGEFDWANVPKLDYATFKFKQLATPEPAKVLDEDSEFVLETFGKSKTFRPDIFNMRTNNEKNVKNINRFFSQTGRVINSKYSNLNSIYKKPYKNETTGDWIIPKRTKKTKKELNNLKREQEKNRQEWENKFLERSDAYLDNNNKHLSKYESLLHIK